MGNLLINNMEDFKKEKENKDIEKDNKKNRDDIEETKEIKSKTEKHKDFQKRIFYLIFAVIFVGLLVPFGAQFLLPFFNPLEKLCSDTVLGSCVDPRIPGAEVWNTYVGIILGVIAVVSSLISLYLGFMTMRDSEETERRTRALLGELEKKVDSIGMEQKQMHDQQNILLNAYQRIDESKNIGSEKISNDLKMGTSSQNKRDRID